MVFSAVAQIRFAFNPTITYLPALLSLYASFPNPDRLRATCNSDVASSGNHEVKP